MTFKDRTQEFNSVAESIRSKQNGKSHWKATMHPKSQFMLMAGQIGKDIAETSDKLNKLTKRTLIFNPSASKQFSLLF